MLGDKVKELERENLSLKLQIEQLQMICGGAADIPKNCEYCSNFVQHYFKSGKTYSPMNSGHCMAGNRIKSKKLDETCKAFVKRDYEKNYYQA